MDASSDDEARDLAETQEGLDLFLQHVISEVRSNDWTPRAAQVLALHANLAAVYHAWLRQNDRHP
jgi:uncharacterized protein (UPF0305 family)